MKSDRIYIRITPELRSEAQAAADKQGFTLSGLITWLLVQYLNQLKPKL
ncbi:MAG: hypothetical protein WC547_01120 [Candidatus Omnitrophota bacterium]